MTFGPEQFRRTLGRFATGVTVVTTTTGDVLHGMTANAFSSVSLDPLLVLVCIDHRAGMHDLLPAAGHFAVTILAASQQRESVWFASPRRPSGHDQFDGIDWMPAPVTGSPVLRDGIAFVDCRVHEVHDGGDHTIFLGEVLAGELLPGGADGGDPLLWYGGQYRRLHVPPDATADEGPGPS
jgi:flavin reductase